MMGRSLGRPRESQRGTLSRTIVSSELFANACRFAVSGVFVTAMHFAIALLLIERAGTAPAIGNGIAFMIATGVSYVINTTWSFSTQLGTGTLIKFMLVSGAGLVVAASVSWLADQHGLSHIAGIFLVACTVPPVTFMLHRLWTYRQ
jgi:putative flippase GtrA